MATFIAVGPTRFVSLLAATPILLRFVDENTYGSVPHMILRDLLHGERVVVWQDDTLEAWDEKVKDIPAEHNPHERQSSPKPEKLQS